MAPGVDRMIMLLRNEENIREIIPFPMSGTAQDLMCGAPNEVTEQQLREVHIKVKEVRSGGYFVQQVSQSNIIAERNLKFCSRFPST